VGEEASALFAEDPHPLSGGLPAEPDGEAAPRQEASDALHRAGILGIDPLPSRDLVGLRGPVDVQALDRLLDDILRQASALTQRTPDLSGAVAPRATQVAREGARRARVVDVAQALKTIEGFLDLLGLVPLSKELIAELRAPMVPPREQVKGAGFRRQRPPTGYLISLWGVCFRS